METAINRRHLIGGAAVASLASLLPGKNALLALAQADHGLFEEYGLPEITVSVTNDSYSLSESEVSAGRYLFTLVNESDYEVYASVVELTDTITLDRLTGLEDEELDHEELPEWLFEMNGLGGAVTLPGTSVRFVLDLPAGEYAVLPEAPDAPLGPAALVVTGELPDELPAITSDASFEMTEMAFHSHSGIGGGSQVVEVINAGAQPHFAVLVGVPDGTTIEDFEALMGAFATGDFEGVKLSPDDLIGNFETSMQSPGTTMWIEVDVSEGTYLLLCFFPDIETGAPHAMLGMVEIIVVD